MSFMEVMVSVVLLSILLLGLDAVQLVSLREANVALNYAFATQQLDVIAEEMRAFNGQIPAQYWQQWNKENALGLPHGEGKKIASGILLSWGNPSQACHPPQLSAVSCLIRNL